MWKPASLLKNSTMCLQPFFPTLKIPDKVPSLNGDLKAAASIFSFNDRQPPACHIPKKIL
jgi:hypothetical protein